MNEIKNIFDISNEATRLERERCLKIVEMEPNFEDEIPDDIWYEFCQAVILNDKNCIVECFRLVVTSTKNNIKSKIEAG